MTKLKLLTAALSCTVLIIVPLTALAQQDLTDGWDYLYVQREDGMSPDEKVDVPHFDWDPGMIDGNWDLSEWTGSGALPYEVRQTDKDTGDPMPGTLYFGGGAGGGMTADNIVILTDWRYDDNPLYGWNAWQLRTGEGNWMEIQVEATPEQGDADTFYVRYGGQDDPLEPGGIDWTGTTWESSTTGNPIYGVNVGGGMRTSDNPGGDTWFWELGIGPIFVQPAGPPQPGPPPDIKLPPCWEWVWRQIDPDPYDGYWEPVYNHDIHQEPEPGTILLMVSGLAWLGIWLRRRKSA